MSNLELSLNKIIKYGLYAILLTPLVFWPRALYGFMTPKFILFQILVEIVFVSWILLIIYRGEVRKTLSNLKNNYIFLALLSLFIIYFISAAFGVDFNRSLWGIGARMTGLFAELHFFAWFLVLISYFKTDTEKWHRYINFSFAVSVLVVITGFFTVSEWRLVPGYTIFSNPTFAAPYFLFHLFWGLYKIWKNQLFNKLLFTAGNVLILIALFLGQIRGAVIGLMAGVLFLGVGLILSDIFNRRKRIILAASYLLLLLGVIFFWQWRDIPFVQSVGILKKFSEISTSAATVQTRLLTWQSVLKGFKDGPIFGAGPENFNYVFNAHYNPRLLMFGGASFAETWQDKPHNAFLEVLAENGIIGMLTYIIFWLTVTFCLFRLFLAGEKLLFFALSGAFISYLGLMFFSFDSFGSWLGLYLFLAFLASQEVRLRGFLSPFGRSLEGRKSDFDIGNMRMPRIANFYSQLASLAIVLTVLALSYVNYSIWRANLANADALRIFSKDPAQGIELFKKSLNYSTPYKAEYQFDLVASVAGALGKNLPIPQLEDNLNFALDAADEAIKAHPKNAAYYTDMVKIYNILGEKGRNPEILNQAEMFGKKSLELSQNRQETRFYLARTALLKGDSKLALKWSKEAEELDPTVNLSRWYLGLALIADNQKEAGKIEIKKALELGYQPQNETEKNFIKNLGL